MNELRISGPVEPGEILDGRYRLEQLIGEGGMGSVWRASDDGLGRTVAIKIFATGTAVDSGDVRRESEKRLLASVSHPSLVTLFDAHISRAGRSYLVMEHIDGGTLADLIDRGPIASPDAASLAADLGEALHVVHQAGIIHRDVKPANILLRPPLTPEHTFRAVLADFGIAYLADTARVTTPGMAVGTAAYISPEQVRGHEPSPASDVYSLGLVLLEALSGQRAFAQQHPVEAVAVRLSTPPHVRKDWGSGWRSLLTAMTAIDPRERPTALEVSRRGRDIDRGETALAVTGLMTEQAQAAAQEPTAPTARISESPDDIADDESSGPTARSRRRGPALLAVSGVGLAAVGAVIVLAAWGGFTPSDDTSPVPATVVETETTATPSPVSDSEPAIEPAPVIEPAPEVESGVDGGPADQEETPANENSGPGNNNGNGNGNGNGKGKDG